MIAIIADLTLNNLTACARTPKPQVPHLVPQVFFQTAIPSCVLYLHTVVLAMLELQEL